MAMAFGCHQNDLVRAGDMTHDILCKEFLTLSKKTLSILAQKYNMVITDEVHNNWYAFVRYESSVSWLKISIDRYSLFVDIGSKRLNQEFSLHDVLAFLAEKNESASFMVRDVRTLAIGIERLVGYVDKYCPDVLTGNRVFFANMNKFMKNRDDRLTIVAQLKEVDQRAITAWQSKDYRSVVEIYTPFIGQLTSIQKKRLEFSYERLKPHGTT